MRKSGKNPEVAQRWGARGCEYCAYIVERPCLLPHKKDRFLDKRVCKIKGLVFPKQVCFSISFIKVSRGDGGGGSWIE